MTDVRPEAQAARRRIDRLLSEDYLAGLSDLALGALRTRRRDAEQEASDLSYRRALVRGRLDLARAELARRRGDAPEGPGLVSQLPEILGSDLRLEPDSGRFSRVQPNVLDEHRRLEDKLLSETALTDVTATPEQDLVNLVPTLTEFDGVLSRRQARVSEVFEALSAELARRYRDGEAKVDDLLRDPEVES